MEGTNGGNGSEGAGTLRVNPDGLHRFADNLRARSGAVTALNVGDGFAAAVTALPGTEFGTVVQQATDSVNNSVLRIGERLTKIADSTQNAAKVYEVAEADFTSRLQTIGLQL